MPDDRITLFEVSDRVRHFDVAFAGSQLARVYCEVLDGEQPSQSTCRIHFDGDVRPDTMREVIESVKAKVLPELPRGVCIVYRGHLVSSFDYGS